MKFIFIILLSLFPLSCAHVNIEDAARKQNSSGASSGSGRQAKTKKNSEPEFVPPPPDVVVVERPVFIPEKEPQRAPAAPGTAAVRESNKAGIVLPSDYSHAAVVYDYNPDWVYEVYAMPLRVSVIRLEPGERALEIPFISDSERWYLGAGVSLENGVSIQHIYVKPAAASQEASLIINTDRRVYHVILRSYNSVYMPLVRWRYHSGLPQNYVSSQPSDPAQNLSGGSGPDNPFSGVDPRFLSFNYRITYPLFARPVWMPALVFDDGSKTYITFPDNVLQRELPAVFENRKDVLNYRVMGKLIVIDKLVENITVKIGRKEITISKKRG